MISPDESRDEYDSWHERHEVDHLADAPWHRLVKEHLQSADLAGKKVLEIGCGRGGFSCWLGKHAESPKRIVAADFSPAAVRKAQALVAQNGLSQIDCKVMDIQSISYDDESFDTVISCETIEHVLDPRKAVVELARVLRPGGRLFLTTPNYMGTMGLYRLYLRLYGRTFTEVGQPINNSMFFPRTRSMVQSAGLKIIAIDGVGHYLPIKGRPPVELSALNNPRKIMRWFALHSLIVAEKTLIP